MTRITLIASRRPDPQAERAHPAALLARPTVIGRELPASRWDELAQDATKMAAPAQLVGMPAAVPGAAPPPPARLGRRGLPGQPPPLVLDLSAMWAGGPVAWTTARPPGGPGYSHVISQDRTGWTVRHAHSHERVHGW
jgi:hypothetical protein